MQPARLASPPRPAADVAYARYGCAPRVSMALGTTDVTVPRFWEVWEALESALRELDIAADDLTEDLIVALAATLDPH